MDEIEQKGEGYYANDNKINSILYADDAIILNDNMQNVRKNLKMLKEYDLRSGFEINTEKSKMIVFDKKRENLKNI